MATIDLENFMFEYLDQIKILVSPQAWGSAILECTKSELFVLVLLYRQSQANMTQIAEYIEVPLNTATGIIARMEKRKLICRQRSELDKRVVTISLTENGLAQIQDIKDEFLYYGQKLFKELEPEEVMLVQKVFQKLIRVLQEDNIKETEQSKKKVKKIVIE